MKMVKDKIVSDSLHVDNFIVGLRAATLPQVFSSLSQKIAQDTGLPESYFYAKFIDHERKATSGIGNGVAIPQLRLKKIERPYFAVARLSRLVDFHAVDGRPVDLVLTLLSPKDDVTAHLRRLSRLSRLLRDEALRVQLRDVDNRDACQALLLASQDRLLAA